MALPGAESDVNVDHVVVAAGRAQQPDGARGAGTQSGLELRWWRAEFWRVRAAECARGSKRYRNSGRCGSVVSGATV
jgi:hypothetical protein